MATHIGLGAEMSMCGFSTEDGGGLVYLSNVHNRRPSVANVSLSTEHSYGPRVHIPHQNVRLVIALIDF